MSETGHYFRTYGMFCKTPAATAERSDELMAIDNMDVLNRNGFDIAVDDSEDRDPSKPRLSLVGQPVSKSTTFDMKGPCENFHFRISPEFHFAHLMTLPPFARLPSRSRGNPEPHA
jgi:hypothetical protein